MSLSEHYQASLNQPDMVHDEIQQQAIIKLEALSEALVKSSRRPGLDLLARLSPFSKHHMRPVKGMYIWGGVGRGKTWLMNLFYEELPIN